MLDPPRTPRLASDQPGPPRINQGRHVWIRCRWSNQWLEPEITRADFDAMIATPDRAIYPSVEQGLIALGFDRVFTGSYLP